VAERLEQVDPADIWSEEVRDITGACDLVVCNLECCISARGAPTELVPGKPFFFRAPPAAVESLRAINATAVSLANNHALDFGPEALEDTLHHLEAAGMAAVGAGHAPAQARCGIVVEGGGVRLGIVAVSDHPRQYAAAQDSSGVAYADLPRGAPGWLHAEIARLREEADLVLVLPHWGPNMTVRPAPWQRNLAVKLLAAGSDMVAGHSAHVFHGIESTARGLVVHDLGDALDDYAVDPALRNDLGVLALWRPGGDPPLELVGLKLEFCHTRLASGEDAEWIARRLERACGELGAASARIAEQRFAIIPLSSC
jgi:poly-gamma-glutamate capsule biosynthesis protein CapA/YwtB (metallophosphatase superfamily)